MYIARLPKMDSALEYVKTVPVESEGHGIAREVLAFRLP